MPPAQKHRLEELRLEYAARFRHICRDMNSGDFAALVDEMARVRYKYEELEVELAKRVGGTPQ